MPVFCASPTATGASAAMVPTLVPIDSEMKHEATKMPASSRFDGRTDSVRFTMESMAPMSFALCANAPAMMNIHTISSMLPLLAPVEKILMRSFRPTPRIIATA